MRKKLTEDQIKWLAENYPIKTNKEICEYIVCSASFLHKIRKEYGWEKSKEFMNKCALENGIKGVEASRRNNWKSQRESIIKSHKEGKMKRYNNVSPWSRMSDEEKENLRKKLSEARKKLIEDERRRIRWGLEQKTKLRNINESNPQRKWAKSWLINKKGYIFVRKWIFAYTPETKRNIRLEGKHSKKFNFKFVEYEKTDTCN